MPRKSDSDWLIRNCKFGYQCTARWEDLAHTKKINVRFCGKCEQKVYWCDMDSDLHEAILRNRCVALFREGETLMGDVAFP